MTGGKDNQEGREKPTYVGGVRRGQTNDGERHFAGPEWDTARVTERLRSTLRHRAPNRNAPCYCYGTTITDVERMALLMV